MRRLVVATADQGRARIDRAAMLRMFDAVEADGTVTANEFRSLAAVVRNERVVDMPGSVRNLARKTVLGNLGNGTFQGQPLGNLRAGSGARVLANLVDKWFLGGEVPMSPIDKATGQPGGSNVIALASAENPDGMFIANGDGTHTVRFHVKAQTGRSPGPGCPTT